MSAQKGRIRVQNIKINITRTAFHIDFSTFRQAYTSFQPEQICKSCSRSKVFVTGFEFFTYFLSYFIDSLVFTSPSIKILTCLKLLVIIKVEIEFTTWTGMSNTVKLITKIQCLQMIGNLSLFMGNNFLLRKNWLNFTSVNYSASVKWRHGHSNNDILYII